MAKRKWPKRVPMESNKDVTIHVTGVSMSGESGLKKDDTGRHPEEDKIRVDNSEESDSK